MSLGLDLIWEVVYNVSKIRMAAMGTSEPAIDSTELNGRTLNKL